MAVPLAFRLALAGLVLTAWGALALTPVLEWPALAGVGLLLLGSWWAEPLRGRISDYRRLWDRLTVLFLLFALLDLTLLAESLIAALIHLLLFLLIFKLYNLRSHRDCSDTIVLTFLVLIASATLTVSFGFLPIFSLYLLLGIWTLLLFHLQRETDLAAPERSRELLADPGLVSPGFLLGSLGVGLLALLVTLTIFVIIPRVGLTFIPLRAQIGTLMTGFTDRVDLGSYAAIQNDPTIVMRVSFPDRPMSAGPPPALRWRGVAFDRFDGRSWSLAVPARAPLRRGREGHYAVAPFRVGAPLLSYEVFLEPIGSEMLFTVPRVVAVSGNFPLVAVDAGGGLSLAGPPGVRIRYLGVSQPEPHPPAGLDRPAGPGDYPPEIRAAYLQLPDLSPRVRALAQELTAGAVTPYQAARRVEAHLSTSLRYTLDLRGEPAEDPLDDFLFTRQAGNCEFFAASMAVLLRAAGIPARVVNGFQAGEWNEVGQYLAVRQRDAHSWVEVFVPGAGWLGFDPSPRAAFESALFGRSGWALQSFDALRMRWNRYVIDYNLGDQAALAMGLRRQSLSFRQSLGQAWDQWTFQASRQLRRLWEAYRLPIVGLLALLAAAALLRRTRGSLPGLGGLWPARVRRGPTVAFYERALALLARHGRRRGPAATAREFAGTFADRPELQAPLWDLTGLYERARFAGEPLTPEEQRHAETLLRRLAAALR